MEATIVPVSLPYVSRDAKPVIAEVQDDKVCLVSHGDGKISQDLFDKTTGLTKNAAKPDGDLVTRAADNLASYESLIKQIQQGGPGGKSVLREIDGYVQWIRQTQAVRDADQGTLVVPLPFSINDPVRATLGVKYFDGGPLGAAPQYYEIDLRVTRSGEREPLARVLYTFGAGLDRLPVAPEIARREIFRGEDRMRSTLVSKSGDIVEQVGAFPIDAETAKALTRFITLDRDPRVGGLA